MRSTGPDQPSSASRPQRLDLRAFNSDVSLITYAPDGARRLALAARWLAAFEARFSRFRPLSELSRLNATAPRPFRCSPMLFDLVSIAVELARRSDGLFDPTVLADLLRAGYDRSFDLLAPGPSRPAGTPPESRVSWRDIELDPTNRSVRLPPGAGIDLGGIAKGWAVDRLAAMLGAQCLVNGGGDVRVRGRPHDAPRWLVGVADPFRPEADLRALKVSDRGVATSSSLKRRWQAGDVLLHHIIDPRTGRPSQSDAVQVTAIAASTVLAEFHARVALILGVERGLAYLNGQPAVEGLFVRDNRSLFETRDLHAYAARP